MVQFCIFSQEAVELKYDKAKVVENLLEIDIVNYLKIKRIINGAH